MSDSSNAFSELGLSPELVETITTLGYEAPTPIQQRTIPLMLSGRDLIGQAQTGTGKTAAFALPILAKVDPKLRQTQALVLTPTRELAMQVADAIHKYSAKIGPVNVLPVYGGAPIVPQLKRLERGVHVVVGTPGRIIDHLDRGSLDLSKIRVFVLDEADEMLKMGFVDEVEKILAAASAERQIALFSATMPEEVMRIAKRHLRNPERVEIEHRTVSAPAIEQRFLNVSEGQKLEVLTQILELEPAEAVLIFRRTKTGSAELAEKLEGRGFAAVAMHGDMTQPLRESVIRRLRAGQVEIVVATDVAARGLDVEQIEHVINYDVPYDVEAYVHRIGRTGRAGRSGVATLFITPRERKMMREIERYTGTQIKPMKMPTRADIAAKRIGVFKDTVRKTIAEGDLDMYLELVEQIVEEGPHDMAEVAAAAARIANGSRALVREREQETSVSPAAAEPQEQSGDDKTITLSMAVGRADGIRPADVVGSIANEADIPGRDIGPIDIQENVTYVGVPQRFVERVLDKVGKAKFRGRHVNLKVALPGMRESARTAPPRRTERSERSERPERDRPERDRPERTERDRPPRAYNSERPPARSAGPRPYNADRPAPRPGPRPYNPDRPAPRPGPRPYNPDGPPRRADRGPARDTRPARDARPVRDTRPRTTTRDAGPPRRDDRLPGREYSPKTGKPFYSDYKKGSGKKRK